MLFRGLLLSFCSRLSSYTRRKGGVLNNRTCRRFQGRTIRAVCGPGHSGDFADTAPVPTCAKNKAFQMDTRLLAVGDWRGPMVRIACFAAPPAFLHVLHRSSLSRRRLRAARGFTGSQTSSSLPRIEWLCASNQQRLSALTGALVTLHLLRTGM